MHAPYHPDHAGLGYYGHAPVDPSLAYNMHHQQHEEGYYGMQPVPTTPQDPLSPAANKKDQSTETKDTQTEPESGVVAGDQTPYKRDHSKTPRSPYWGHLDATIAMGLATPQTNVKQNVGFMSPEESSDTSTLGNAQPLLLRQSQYYGYGPVSNVS